MKEAAAPFAVAVLLVVISAISAAMVRSRVTEYIDARETRRRRRRERGDQEASPHDGHAPAVGADADIGDGDVADSSDPERDAGAVAIYAAWAIDAAQALVVAIAPPVLALLVFTDAAGKYLALAYVASTVAGLILFWAVLYCAPDDYDRRVRAKGLLTPVVVVALSLNLAAFAAVQAAAPEHSQPECGCSDGKSSKR